MSTIENYAEGDAVQIMVSTNGKPLYGKNQGWGWRTRQLGGYISDASLMQISRDLSSYDSRDLSNHTLRGNTALHSDNAIGISHRQEEQTKELKLTPMTTPCPTPLSAISGRGVIAQ